jgi:hypothetical protein
MVADMMSKDKFFDQQGLPLLQSPLLSVSHELPFVLRGSHSLPLDARRVFVLQYCHSFSQIEHTWVDTPHIFGVG